MPRINEDAESQGPLQQTNKKEDLYAFAKRNGREDDLCHLAMRQRRIGGICAAIAIGVIGSLHLRDKNREIRDLRVEVQRLMEACPNISETPGAEDAKHPGDAVIEEMTPSDRLPEPAAER